MRPPLAGEHFDVAVIGGGINGVAIARACARAGRRTLLVEQNDFASGTTSRSTRIIHGGLRYLEHGELGLVRESLRERERMRREYPHLVRPLTFLLALQPGGRHSALAIRAGLWLYRFFAPSDRRDATPARDAGRLLDAGERWSLFDYEDAQCEFPERLVAEWLVEATAAGAVVRNHCTALEVKRRDGCVYALALRDALTRREEEVFVPQVVNATGPWADRVAASAGIHTDEPMVGGVRGSHIVVARFPGAPEGALYTEAADGRPIFVIPWNGQLLVGTTEVPDSGDPERTQPSAEETAYLLSSLRALFPGANVSGNDIRFAFAGVRPLPYAPATQPSAVTRRHILRDHAEDGAAGMLSLIGGKLTTAASVARDVARALGIRATEPPLPQVAPAPGDGIELALRTWSRQAAGMAGIPEASARAIAEWHGKRALCVARLAGSDPGLREPLCPHSDHIVAEAVEAVRYEAAVTLGDVLLRRVPVALGACWSEECTRHAAARVGRALGLSGAQIARAAEEFEAERDAFLVRPALRPQRAA